MLISVGGYNFLDVPFLVQFPIPCNVLGVLSFFPRKTYRFSERLDASCCKAMAFRMVEIEQQYVFQERKKINRKDNVEQSGLDKLAALLHDCCRNVASV